MLLRTSELCCQVARDLKLWKIFSYKKLDKARNNTRLYNFLNGRTALYKLKETFSKCQTLEKNDTNDQKHILP